MTQMPYRRLESNARSARKSASRRGRPVMARTLQELRSSVYAVSALGLVALVGCVIPPSLKVDTQDAGVNSPPAIVAVSSDLQTLPEPGPLLFEQGTSSQLNLTLLDTDIGETLYVRIFVDYNDPVLGPGADPTPPRSTCVAASASTAQRTATCDLTGLCETQDVGQTRSMTVVVFDREPLDTGTPLYQAMKPDASGAVTGLSTSRFYYLKCQPRSS